MVKTLELFDTREEAYSTATWLGSLAIMNRVGNLDSATRGKASGLGAHIVRFCVSVANKPLYIPSNLENYWGASKTEKFRALASIGLYDSDGVVNPDFMTAIDIYNDEQWQTLLQKNSNFGELIDISYEMADNLAPSAISNLQQARDMASCFENIYRDMNFYIGLYDPER